MALRNFRDNASNEWKVWNVTPPPSRERRQLPTRRIAIVDHPGPERRTIPDRRVSPDRRAQGYPGAIRDWLCFQSGREKRRLGPVPAAWEAFSEVELRALLRYAGPELRRGEPTAGER